jgi:hypothetical protein
MAVVCNQFGLLTVDPEGKNHIFAFVSTTMWTKGLSPENLTRTITPKSLGVFCTSTATANRNSQTYELVVWDVELKL